MANADKFLEELEKQKKKKKKRGEDTSSLEPTETTTLKGKETSSSPQVDSFFDALNTEREKLRKRESVTWEDIAPVKPTVGTTDRVHGGRGGSFTVKSEEDDSLLDFFDAGSFRDGYQFGDVSKAILGTVGDIGVGAVKGVMKMGEGIGDAAQYGVAAVADAFGGDEWADKVRKNAQRTAVDDAFAPVADYLDKYSVLGRTMNSATEAIGQIGAIIATGGIAAGVGGAGAAAAATTGMMAVSGFGTGTGEAYKGGAAEGEAELYGAISGAADAITEMLSGGLGKGVKAVGLSHGLGGLDDILAKKVSEKISNTIARNAVQLGIKAGAEGTEEVLAGLAQAAGKKLTYMSEEEIGQIIEDENLLEQFVVGAMASGVAQVPSFSQANKTDTDFITGRTKNEQAVIDRVVEQRTADAQKDGKKLSKKEIQTIEEEAAQDMERGRIDVETIEEVLGGEEYRAYQDAVKEEDALRREYEELGAFKEPTLAERTRYEELHAKKDELYSDERRNALKSKVSERVSEMAKTDRLSESYAERARRGEYFADDVTKYRSDAAKKTVQNLIDSKIANNTGHTHELAASVAKIADDRGIVFNFTNNQKLRESGKTAEVAANAIINGYKDAEGITVNLDSPKAWQFIVGHEVTHTLEGTAEYTELADAVKVYAQTKGEYDSRRAAIASLYAEGTDVDSELTADVLGEYVFTDEQFVTELSTKHQNVFQRVFAEIKHLLKMVTTGSKEARQLEQVKHTFERAYRAQQAQKADGKTQHSLGYHAGDLGKAEFYHQQGRSRGTGHFGTGTYFVGDEQKISGDNTYGKRPHHAVEFDNYNLYKVRGDKDGFSLHDQLKVIDGGFDAAYLRAAQEDKFRLSELRTEAYDRAEGYVTKTYDEELGFDVFDNYTDANIRAFTEVAGENGIEIQSYDEWLAEQDDDVPSPGDSDYDFYKTDYLDYLKGTLEEADSARNDGYADFRDAYFNLWLRFGKKNTDQALQAVIEHDAAMMPDGEFDYLRAQKMHADSRATVFMKALGYEGIDTRGTALDNVEYGSVIYDLKGADAQKKAENGAKISEAEVQVTNETLQDVGVQYDAKSETVSYSLSSLEDTFSYNKGEAEYMAARDEYVTALAKATGKTTAEANRYLDSLFLVHDMIAADRDRLDYEAAVDRSAWVSNAEYGGSIDFSTLCAKRRLFTGTFDAIQQRLPDTVLNENDFLRIRNLLLEKGQESPCSMCYVEGSRAKHGVYVKKFLDDYLKTDPEWKPQIADFTSTTRLEQTRIQHPEAYKAYTQAMNALSQRKPKEASVRTDYKGEILEAFRNDTTVAEKNKNGGVRFNSFSDFEIIHALDAMQVLTDMARVGLNGQAYTKVKEFAEAFGNTGLKINLSLVAKGVDADGKLIMDETNGMNYAEALDIRSRYSENVGTVIVVFNDAQLKAALADNTIDYVLPFHRSQWKKSQYTMMGLPAETRDYTNIQNDRYKNPTTGRAKKAPDGNIMPNEYWDFNLSGRENAQKYLDYINEHGYIPKFDHVLNKVDGKWVLPEGAVGDGYYKLLIDFKMYDNDGWGSPQRPVLPEFNMPYIQRMLDDYVGGHQAFPVAHDVVDAFVAEKQHSLSAEDEHPVMRGTAARELRYQGEDVAPVAEMPEDVPAYTDADAPPMTEDTAPMMEEMPADDLAGVSSAVETEVEEIDAPVSDTADIDAAVGEIQTTYDKILAKKQNAETELANNREQRAASAERLQTRIDELQKKYDGKKRKDTKAANNLLRQIERLKRLKSDIDADYAKRISGIEKSIARRDFELNQDHTEADKLERAYAKIDQQLELDRAAVEEEFAQRREELSAAIADKNTYVGERAKELYSELSHLKKGVRASYELGYLLDHGYDWRTLKSTLLKVNLQPDGVINPESAEESVIREMLNEEYASKTFEIGELDGEMQDRLAELEADAEKQKAEVRKNEQQLRRKQVEEMKMNDMKVRFAQRGYDLDVVLRTAKDVSGWTTVDKTPQRVNYAVFGDEAGEIMNDLTVNQVAQSNTEGIRWLNRYLDPKTGEVARISRQYHIKPGSKESAAAQMYAEGFYVDEYNEIVKYGDRELAADFPDAKVQDNIKGLARDGRIRAIYDETLDAMNEVRVRNGYPEIPKRQNYYLHFREMGDFFSTMGTPFNPDAMNKKDLPTDINGMTADLKPGKPYFASEHQRKGKRTSFDLLGGLEQYLTSAKDQIYQIDNIQAMRALRNYIADDFGQAKGLESLAGLDEAEVQERIELVFGNHLSTYAKFLNEEANILAGKTALIDRALEGVLQRRGMTFMTELNKQVGANQVGFNISSSLTNFIAPVQAFAKMNKGAFVRGFAQTVSNRIGGIFGRGDNFAAESPVMVRREGAKRFKTNWWQRRQDNAYALMGAVDSLTTEIITRAKFAELTAKGMDSAQAHYETDKWVSALMGDRSLGQMPHLFNSKTFGMVLKYQLEVRNQIDSMFADTIREAKLSTAQIEDIKKRNAVKAAKIASTFATLAVGQHIFGQVFESIAGYNPAFDIIEAIIKAAGWDDDEDDDDTVLDNLEQGLLSIAEDMPYYSILSGGRIPIESALPIETLIKGKDSYGNEVSRWKTLAEAAPYYVLPGGYGQIKKTAAGLSMYSDEHPVAGSYTDSGNMRFPVGETPLDVAQAAVFGQYSSANARDYFDNERKPLSPKQVDEYAAADMTIQDYWKYRDGLKEHDKLAEQAEYINSLDIPTWKKNLFINNLTDRKEAIDMADYGQYGSLEEMDFAKKSPEKYKLLQDEGVSYEQFTAFDDKKKNAYSWAAENPEKYSFVRDIGYTLDDYARATDTEKDAFTWAYKNPEKYLVSRAISDDLFVYRGYTDALNDIKADKDFNGNTITGSRKDKVVEYINGLDADYGAKIILLKSEYPSEDSYNYDIIDYLNEREDISAEEMTVILTQLGFRVTSDGTITWD